MQGCETGGTCIPANPFGIAGVSTVELIDIPGNVPMDPNPNTGGGRRIYPDKQTPGDGTVRRKVRVKATLTLPAANFLVLFQSYDMDDTSSNVAAVDPDTHGANTGDDNRAATNKAGVMSLINQTGTTNTVGAVSDGSGVAEADLWTTMHPGDNFMAAAAGFQTVLDGLTVNTSSATVTALKDANNNTLPVDRAKASPLLTVWRKIIWKSITWVR